MLKEYLGDNTTKYTLKPLALIDILNSEKTNIGKLELVKQLEEKLLHEKNIRYINILNLILNKIKTKPTWGKNQLKDLFLEKILNNL